MEAVVVLLELLNKSKLAKLKGCDEQAFKLGIIFHAYVKVILGLLFVLTARHATFKTKI